MKKYSYVIGNPPYITITHKIQKEKINMNNKKIMKVTSTIPLLLTLALTACGTQNSQTLTMVEEVTQTDGTRETDTNTEVAADTESPWRRGMLWSGSSVWTTVLRGRCSWLRSRWI